MNTLFVTNTEVTIYGRFKKIVQSGNYETVVFEIMKSSQVMFPNQYVHNEKQPNGECDYVEIPTGKKYDAKLPFTTNQGKLIGSNKGDVNIWLQTMIDEVLEFYELIKNGEKLTGEGLTLYQVFKEKLENIEQDENLIVFFPFPVVTSETPGSIYLQFATTILTVIFDTLEKNDLINGREIFVIYPCVDNKLAIRFLNKRTCEYVSDEPIKKYIDYNISHEFY